MFFIIHRVSFYFIAYNLLIFILMIKIIHRDNIKFFIIMIFVLCNLLEKKVVTKI